MITNNLITLKLHELAQEIIRPHDIQVQFNDRKKSVPIYLGIIAYDKFEKKKTQKEGIIAAHDYIPLSENLLPGRLILLRKILDYLYISSNREITKKSKINKILYFTEWFMLNKHNNFMESEEYATQAYIYWTREIEQRMKTGTLSWSRKTAASYQRDLLELFRLRFGNATTYSLQQSIYMFSGGKTVKNVRSYKDAGTILNSFNDIANGLTDLIADENDFPYKIKYLGKYFFIFPNDQGYVKTQHTSFIIDCYDYESGIVLSPENLYKIPVKERKLSLWSVKCAQRNLVKNNENKLSLIRLRFADIACCCYLEIFLILTGMSRSEVIQIDNVDVIASERTEYSNEFRAVKFRANGKSTSYRLHRQGVKALNGYLRLRRWLVSVMKQEEPSKLFIRVVTPSGKYSTQHPRLRDINDNDIGRVYSRLQGKFFPIGMKTLTVQESRRLKTVILHDSTASHKAIAGTLNHSESTSLNIYTNTKTTRCHQEMSTYWNSIKQAAKQIRVFQFSEKETAAFNNTSISIGHCIDYEKPNKYELNPLIEPNCKTQYGCLFCTNYCCHADEVDIHKLLSLGFVVSNLKSKSLFLDSHHDTICKLHIKINSVLSHVRSSSVEASSIYENTYKRVWEFGELTPFWELRLRRYESMGVIF